MATPVFCIRTIELPTAPEAREAFFRWVEECEPLRRRWGCRLERVLLPCDGQGEVAYVTLWESHERFDAWIASQDRLELMQTPGYSLVTWHPLKRYDVSAGYGLVEAAAGDGGTSAAAAEEPERS